MYFWVVVSGLLWSEVDPDGLSRRELGRGCMGSLVCVKRPGDCSSQLPRALRGVEVARGMQEGSPLEPRAVLRTCMSQWMGAEAQGVSSLKELRSSLGERGCGKYNKKTKSSSNPEHLPTKVVGGKKAVLLNKH